MTSIETHYLHQHSVEIEQTYPGEYIAISGNAVVASGHSVAEVYQKVDELGIEDPLVTYVPKDGEELLLI